MGNGGVFAAADTTNTSSSGNGLFRWAPCESPSSTTGNDWGTLTHTFNDTYDYTGYSGSGINLQEVVHGQNLQQTEVDFTSMASTNFYINL